MATVVCPLEGFEQVEIIYPDEWLMKHIDQFNVGYYTAADNAANSTKELFGTLALCDSIKGIDTDSLGDMPLSYKPMFNWLVKEVYLKYIKAMTVPNPSTPV